MVALVAMLSFVSLLSVCRAQEDTTDMDKEIDPSAARNNAPHAEGAETSALWDGEEIDEANTTFNDFWGSPEDFKELLPEYEKNEDQKV